MREGLLDQSGVDNLNDRDVLLIDNSGNYRTVKANAIRLESGTYVKVLDVAEGKIVCQIVVKGADESIRKSRHKVKRAYISPVISSHDLTHKVSWIRKQLARGDDVRVILMPKYKVKQMYKNHGNEAVKDGIIKLKNSLREGLGHKVQDQRDGLLIKGDACS